MVYLETIRDKLKKIEKNDLKFILFFSDGTGELHNNSDNIMTDNTLISGFDSISELNSLLDKLIREKDVIHFKPIKMYDYTGYEVYSFNNEEMLGTIQKDKEYYFVFTSNYRCGNPHISLAMMKEITQFMEALK